MNLKDAKDNWKEQEERLRKRFASLRDSDYYFDTLKKELMLGRLQAMLADTKKH